jgi:hypothetical protein
MDDVTGVAVQNVVGIPGSWMSRPELVQALASSGDGYLLGTDTLRHADTGEIYGVDIYPYDETLRHAFALAGGRALSEDDLRRIDTHTSTLYLIGHGGSPASAHAMMRAATAVLQAGGIAVKVESSGIAHSARTWLDLTGETAPEALYQAYVSLVRSELQYYSCGMHVLGYRDVEAPAELEPAMATRLLETFLLYTLQPRVALRDGDTFSTDAASARWRLGQVECTEYAPDDLFFNPFGMWRLTPVE